MLVARTRAHEFTFVPPPGAEVVAKSEAGVGLPDISGRTAHQSLDRSCRLELLRKQVRDYDGLANGGNPVNSTVRC